jgi:phage/plasmid-like protein (TIGR03299 family)
VQNEEAFQFVDQLLGSQLHFETAGSLHGGRRVWVLATLPEHMEVGGDPVRPYVLLMNSHDGSTAVIAATTPVRVVCQNTLNWGLQRACQKFSIRHTEQIGRRVHEARSSRSIDRLLRAVQSDGQPARLRVLHRSDSCCAFSTSSTRQGRRIG